MSYKSVKDVVTMLQENGFVLKSQKGSHMKFEKDGKVVIVPNHNSKGVEKGTYYSILRQAGLKYKGVIGYKFVIVWWMLEN